jgi:hypothetical protein
VAFLYPGICVRRPIRRLLIIPPSFFVNSRLLDFVIQNDISRAIGAGELDPALISDLSNADNMLRPTGRTLNDAAVRAHVDFSAPLR